MIGSENTKPSIRSFIRASATEFLQIRSFHSFGWGISAPIHSFRRWHSKSMELSFNNGRWRTWPWLWRERGEAEQCYVRTLELRGTIYSNPTIISISGEIPRTTFPPLLGCSYCSAAPKHHKNRLLPKTTEQQHPEALKRLPSALFLIRTLSISTFMEMGKQCL